MLDFVTRVLLRESKSHEERVVPSLLFDLLLLQPLDPISPRTRREARSARWRLDRKIYDPRVDRIGEPARVWRRK